MNEEHDDEEEEVPSIAVEEEEFEEMSDEKIARQLAEQTDAQAIMPKSDDFAEGFASDFTVAIADGEFAIIDFQSPNIFVTQEEDEQSFTGTLNSSTRVYMTLSRAKDLVAQLEDNIENYEDEMGD